MTPESQRPPDEGRHFSWQWQTGSGPRRRAPQAPRPPLTGPERVREFVGRWLVTSVGVLVASQIVPGIECHSWAGLGVVALVLGLLNAFVRPLLLLLSLPLLVVSLGLFLWVINAALLSLVAWLVKPFTVANFGSALGGAAVISLVSIFGNALLGLGRRGSRTAPPAGRSVPPREPPPGSGPVIDV